ncbi:MAG TPA: S1/P1 nuclease [Steroidobacteraceae bacterium]
MRKPLLTLAVLAAFTCSQARAWGDLGHEVTALIAYRHLLPAAKAALDALLASDGDTLTAGDFAGRATWADKYRNTHRETAAWHFVDIEIDRPDLADACYGFPASPPGQWASDGPAQDCVVNKIDEFAAELKNPSTPAAERKLALKFLIHFVGDLHQPLHAADHHDRGGNCISLSPPQGTQTNLHAYWDVSVVNALGRSAAQIADQLDARLSAGDLKRWTQGSARSWAMDTFAIGRRDAYALPSKPTCQSGGSVALSPAYQRQAQKDAAMQLAKAAVRLAAVLNKTLG